ncbi:MAG: transposase [Halioglobus sp.]|nr:transposase [Halioglobus sp.]
MNKKEIEADVNKLSSTFRKVLLETMLEAEMDDHLGYDKHEQSEHSNKRLSNKTVLPFYIQ